MAFLSAVGTKSASSDTVTTSNPIHFDTLLDSWFPIKVVSLIICFMMSFFFFTQAMRFLNHAVILVNINISEEELRQLDSKAELAYRVLSADVVGDVLNRGAFSNTAGFRMFYVSFPIIAWIGSPWYLIAASVILVIVLRHVDFNVRLEKRQIVKEKKWWMFRWKGYYHKKKDDKIQDLEGQQQSLAQQQKENKEHQLNSNTVPIEMLDITQ
jgi:uncharacterized membrane protein